MRTMGRLIKERLASGQVVRLFGLGQVFHPKLVEILGEHGGYDGLWLDQEHSGMTLDQLERSVLAARLYGLDHFVRMPAVDYASVMRPLEAGVGGVMFSMIRDAEHAAQAVRWAKFHPKGERGLNGSNRDGRFALMPLEEYVVKANEETFVGIQLETARAIEEAAQIAGIPDVDLLFIGPADLSQVLGVPGQFEHPSCLAAIERIAQVCRNAGKPWGLVPRGADYARRMRSMGCQMFVFGFDHHAMHEGIRAFKSRYAEFFDSAT
jgi:2-keto-3-deoxy-L-rhamnonate aldolase RhmA